MILFFLSRDGGGSIDQDEFSLVIETLKKSTQGSKVVASVGLDGKERHDDLSNSSLFKRFFGEDGRGSISRQEFVDYVTEMRSEVMKLKFARFDEDKSGALDAKEFAMFLASHASKESEKWLKQRVESEEVSSLQVEITSDEFLIFMRLLEQLPRLRIAFSLLGGTDGVSPSQFVIAADAAMGSEKIIISPGIVKVLFALFDKDGDGMLTVDEFISSLERTASLGTGDSRELGVIKKLKDCWTCGKLAFS